MNKKLIIGIGISAVIIAILVGIYIIHVYKPPVPIDEQLSERFSEFKTQYDEKKAEGYDVTEAEGLARKAKQAFDRKDYRVADKFLGEAFEALEKAEIPEVSPTPEVTPTPIPDKIVEEAKEKLSRVKVASLYEKIVDKIVNAEHGGVSAVSKQLNETGTDFVFRAWWRWQPPPNICADLPEELREECETAGGSYGHFANAISIIKEENPDIIICGAIPAQRINYEEKNPITGKVYGEDETGDMALDPAKWNIDLSKEELQERSGGATGSAGYFPDITNPDYQKLILCWAKKQIDCGADAIWIDLLFAHAGRLWMITGDEYHQSVKDSFEASSKIVDEIHEYGYSKYKKHIYVGSWHGAPSLLPYEPPDFDFITVTVGKDEISQMVMDEAKWNKIIDDEIRAKFGNDIPIFACIDWAGTTDTPLGVFSQELTPEEQREFLTIADEFFQKKRVTFVYPIHGGCMGNDATTLAYGKSLFYDSLAPEFQTYETIKELALNKSASGYP